MYREIHIRPVINGFIVKVGCTEIVFTDANEMGAAFVEYISDPRKSEREWTRKGSNQLPGYANEPELGTTTEQAAKEMAYKQQVEMVAVSKTAEHNW